MGDRTICFIDKKGNCAICTMEGLDDEQLVKIFGPNMDINCNKCHFKKQNEGIEKEKFTYVHWLGEI